MKPLIAMENISKTFYGVKALDNIALTLLPGEVHCLAGQNGCGKSTLIKIISGVYQPDAGAKITLDDHVYSHLTPGESVKRGIQVIYQDLSLFPNLSVAENIAINLYHRHLWVNKRSLYQLAQRTLDDIGVTLDLHAPLETLSIAQRQLVAICRALAQDARLIIMDEPTASLTMTEVKGLLRLVHQLKARGICVVFVSHRLDEVMAVSDRITVLQDGEHIGTFPAAEMGSKQLAFLMTGLAFDYRVLTPYAGGKPVVLEVERLSRRDQYHDISLKVHQGEIVAITGLLGAGRTELCLSLFGLTRPDGGSMKIDGSLVHFHSNRDAIAAGIGYVSEDRLSTGLVMEQSIGDNIISTVLPQVNNRWRLIDRQRVQTLVGEMIHRLTIKSDNTSLPVNTLSGGNAQRVAIAKWLATRPRLLILDSPTVGVDIANKAGIYQIVNALAEQGIAVLMICDEIEEAYFNSHRILVMRAGALVAEFLTSETTEAALAEVVNG
ncbi:sugar ABC transporter ATP-binding protein [Acerihabitans arboris]|uniref:ATP-binding cassette domain-containing protein n=1 Tax=Acerihabitans arboris TaxID=2691583 RepID=A0A845SJU2_9GAMM|nr:sugar ABC transporter ATP-binding protein [Acerihabitans arboris]NDL63652.1 ATP-binding cassette domain-containing protein [Acerihabitans arboris]